MDFEHLICNGKLEKSLNSFPNQIRTSYMINPAKITLTDILVARFNKCLAKKYNGIFELGIYDIYDQTQNQYIIDLFTDLGFDNIVIVSNELDRILNVTDMFFNNNMIAYNRNRDPTVKYHWKDAKAHKLDCKVRCKSFYEFVDGVCDDPLIVEIKDGKIFPTFDFCCFALNFLNNISHVAIEKTVFRHKAYNMRRGFRLLDKMHPEVYYYKNTIQDLNYNDIRDFPIPSLEAYLAKINIFNDIKLDMKELVKVHIRKINKFIPRFRALKNDDLVSVEIMDLSSGTSFQVNNYERNVELGKREIPLTKKILLSKKDLNPQINLLYLGRFDYNDGKLYYAGEIKTKERITWLPDNDFNYLFDDMLIEEYIIDYIANNHQATDQMISKSMISDRSIGNNHYVQLYDYGFYKINYDTIEKIDF